MDLQRARFQTLLVATDFTQGATWAVGRAARPPLVPGAKALLLHVIPDGMPPEFRTRADADARRILDEVVLSAFGAAGAAATPVVVSTAIRARPGDIATSVAGADSAKPPLLVRMDRFTRRIAPAIGVAVIILGTASLARGSDARDVFYMDVALAVSAVPEGSPEAGVVSAVQNLPDLSSQRVRRERLLEE